MRVLVFSPKLSAGSSFILSLDANHFEGVCLESEQVLRNRRRVG